MKIGITKILILFLVMFKGEGGGLMSEEVWRKYEDHCNLKKIPNLIIIVYDLCN